MSLPTVRKSRCNSTMVNVAEVVNTLRFLSTLLLDWDLVGMRIAFVQPILGIESQRTFAFVQYSPARGAVFPRGCGWLATVEIDIGRLVLLFKHFQRALIRAKFW